MWIVVNNNDVFYFFVNYDVNNNNWVFYDCFLFFFELWMLGIVVIFGYCDIFIGYGFSIEFILSCLVLYRLVCFMNINVRVYVSMEDVLIWVLYLIYNIIRGVLYLKDLNGKGDFFFCFYIMFIVLK